MSIESNYSTRKFTCINEWNFIKKQESLYVLYRVVQNCWRCTVGIDCPSSFIIPNLLPSARLTLQIFRPRKYEEVLILLKLSMWVIALYYRRKRFNGNLKYSFRWNRKLDPFKANAWKISGSPWNNLIGPFEHIFHQRNAWFRHDYIAVKTYLYTVTVNSDR